MLISLYYRLPRAVRGWIRSLADGKGVLGRAADWVRFRHTKGLLPTLPPFEPTSEIRVVFAPANSAQQGYQWAKTLREYQPHFSALALMSGADGYLAAHADVKVPAVDFLTRREWHDYFESFLLSQTHIIIESARPLLGRKYGMDIEREVRLYRSSGITPWFLFHGSDIRVPSEHTQRQRWSPFEALGPQTRVLEETAQKNRDLAQSLEVPVFVSTPDLMEYVPRAVWLPLVVESRPGVQPKKLPPSGHRPLVVHAPTNPTLKGTALIEKAIQPLIEKGLIEYQRVQGAAHYQMSEIYRRADIVLDQFVIGSYGAVSCEAMAEGAVVLANVDETTRKYIEQETGEWLPIIQANPENIAAVLLQIIDSPDRFQEVSEQGIRFVKLVHSGEYSAGVLRGNLETSQ